MTKVHRLMSNQNLRSEMDYSLGFADYFFNDYFDPKDLNEPYASLWDKTKVNLDEFARAVRNSEGWDEEEDDYEIDDWYFRDEDYND